MDYSHNSVYPLYIMKASPSILGRAVLAIALMVGFYLLAAGIAAGLLYVPYAEFVYANRIHIKLAAVCVVSAVVILWAVLPRIDKFTPPGPQLTPQKHPRLFTELQSVATAVSQEMPAEVYLVHDMNAWVMQRGGLMGMGGRRVMGLGLPLMRMLTVSQLRAVLAHEFGHYYGGDTKVGPWIYKTRIAIIRTVQSLSGSGGEGSLLQLPFQWYGKLFLRITNAISRRQEFVADELAARTIGSKPLIDGLRTVHAAGPAFGAFWSNEMIPVLNAGYRPGLVEGFDHFVRVEQIAGIMSQQIEEEMKSGKSDPYDTHPPLKARIAAVAELPAGQVDAEDPSAISLLEDIQGLEKELLVALAGAEVVAKLKPVDWSNVGSAVYVPMWSALVKPNQAKLAGITPELLSNRAAELKATVFKAPNGQEAAQDECEELAAAVIGAALMLALVARGWKAVAVPGRPAAAEHEGKQIEAFLILGSLSEGKLTGSDWQRQCEEAAICGVDLGAVEAITN